MKHVFYRKGFFIVFGFVIILVFSSCHSSYLSMSTDFSNKYAWKRDSSAFAFVVVNRLYRMPVGIAKFPDGGMSKTVYFDVALYYYDLKNETLHRALEFNDILNLYSKKRKYQYIDLAYDDSLIFCKLSDASEFDIRTAKRFVHNEEDSIKLIQSIKKVSEIRAYNVNTKTVKIFDSLPSNVFWAGYKRSDYLINLRKNCLQTISSADWGIVLKNIYPQSKKKYEKYIVYKEGNKLMRNAVLEQIISQYKEEKILKIINRMKKYKMELEKKAAASVNYKNNIKKEAYDAYYSETAEISMNIIQTKK